MYGEVPSRAGSVRSSRGMRCAAIAFVLTLLLPALPMTGGRACDPTPAPLDFFGGDDGPTAWTPPALVTEVYYHALRPDEYVVVANPGTSPLDVAGWTITDQEGTLTFPAGAAIAANGRAVVAQNSTAYWEDTLGAADFRYGGGNATAMGVSGTFQLNNNGDEVVLRDASGATIDAFAYGASAYAGTGWTGPVASAVNQGLVARRMFEASWRDTNGSADWDLVRVRSLGQSEFATEAFDFTGTVRAFVTPDAQVYPLLDLLYNATSSIDLSLYTFSNTALLNGLSAAIAKGVRVRILLEGAPVGGITEDEWTLVNLLEATPAEVRFLVDNTTLDIQERYRYGHAKYAILDDRTVVVSTENWGASAFPTWPATGSRGWVVAVEHPPLATYFTSVFEVDFDARRRDVFTVSEMLVKPVHPAPEAVDPRPVGFPPRTVAGSFRVIPVIGPDTALAADTILAVVRNATASIHVEVFYAYRAWGPFPNLYLEELLAAARRGVSVRILLDSSSYNIEDDDPIDNDDTVAYVNGIAALETLDVQAKLVDLRAHGFSRMHTKGFVVDGRWVLVSSINWNRNSPTANREVGLLIENVELGAYFDEVFAWDWKDDVTPPVADGGPDRSVRVGDSATFDGLGSSDDVAVVNWSWDLDGDGAFDAWGPEVTHVYREAGPVLVRLQVTDSWNNVGEGIVRVDVRPHVPVGSPFSPWVVVLFVAATTLAIWFARARRSRQRINKKPRM